MHRGRQEISVVSFFLMTSVQTWYSLTLAYEVKITLQMEWDERKMINISLWGFPKSSYKDVIGKRYFWPLNGNRLLQLT